MTELQQMLQTLKQPEYVHVLLNPLPVYATAMGVLALSLALLARSGQARAIALVLVVVGSLSVWPVKESGEQGYDRVMSMSNKDAQQWLYAHAQRADRCQYVFYATAALALASLVAQWRFPSAATKLAVATLLAAMVCVGLGGWISYAGGQVRHSEFREGPPPGAGR